MHCRRTGKPLDVRLVVSEIRAEAGLGLARWRLWTSPQLQVRLSGRRMKRGGAFTTPALLVGRWARRDTIERYTYAERRGSTVPALATA